MRTRTHTVTINMLVYCVFKHPQCFLLSLTPLLLPSLLPPQLKPTPCPFASSPRPCLSPLLKAPPTHGSLTIFVSSFENLLFRFIAHSVIRSFVFLIAWFFVLSSLCVLGINSPSQDSLPRYGLSLHATGCFLC